MLEGVVENQYKSWKIDNSAYFARRYREANKFNITYFLEELDLKLKTKKDDEKEVPLFPSNDSSSQL